MFSQISILHIEDTAARRPGGFDGVQRWGTGLPVCAGEHGGEGGWRLREEGENGKDKVCLFLNCRLCRPLACQVRCPLSVV